MLLGGISPQERLVRMGLATGMGINGHRVIGRDSVR